MADELMRRVPKQARSRGRYEHILDVAANLFTERGFERTTTNEIARQSGMSIGSLYQYFSNKEAVAEALAERYEEALRSVTDDVVHAEVIGLPTANAVDRLVDPFLGFYEANPAFRALWLGSDVSERLHDSVEGMDKEAMARVLGLIEVMIPTMPRRRSMMVAMVMHGAVKSLLRFQERDATDAQRRMAAREVKRMLSDYFLSLMAEYRDVDGDA